MSELYISQYEMTAIRAIDAKEVRRCVDQALDEVRVGPLSDLDLSGCGAHIRDRLRRYERDVANYAEAKAAAKRASTRSQAWSSGHALIDAVREMQRLVDEQERETELLLIDDMIIVPRTFYDRIEVRVRYQWRRVVEDAWAYGTIIFFHTVDMRPDFTQPQPKRKLSASKEKEQRQAILYQHWDHLRTLSLHAVRSFFKSGGDGSTIPETFEARPARNDRYLNNFSCQFWRTST